LFHEAISQAAATCFPEGSTARLAPDPPSQRGWFNLQSSAARPSPLDNPTVFLLAQWWLAHPYRADAVSSQALPLLGLGFQITGDFLPIK
jgi:hypothetical protein